MGFAEDLEKFHTGMTTLADTVREKTGIYVPMNIDDMTAAVSGLGEGGGGSDPLPCELTVTIIVDGPGTYSHGIAYQNIDTGQVEYASVSASFGDQQSVTVNTIQNSSVAIYAGDSFGGLTSTNCTVTSVSVAPSGTIVANGVYVLIEDHGTATVSITHI